MSRTRWSPLAVAVLALLEEAPMHPYRMQVLLKERGIGEVINVAERTSVYKTIERLVDAGLVVVQGTARDESRPERTVYAVTAEGREVLRAWVTQALSTPAREFPEFPAALAFLVLLGPEGCRTALAARREAVAARVAHLDQGLANAPVPRLFLLEDEYRRAVSAAELAWLDAVIADLDAGRLAWDEAFIRAVAASVRQDA